MNSAIYVISTKKQSMHNEYKIGRHIGTVSKLITRYSTYLIKPIVYFFRYVNDATTLEEIIKTFFYDFRICNINNKKSEWIKLQIDILLPNISLLCDDFDDSMINTIIDIHKSIYKIFICYKCGYITDKKYNFSLHNNKKNKCLSQKKLVVKNTPRSKCNVCDRSFARSDSLKRHKKLQHVVKVNDIVKHVDLCITNVIKINNLLRYECTKCTYKTDKKDHFINHLNRKNPCTFEKKNKSIKKYIDHVCNECNKKFSRKDSLNRHNITYH